MLDAGSKKTDRNVTGMVKPLHVLIVEDSEDDALLMVRQLKKGGYDPYFQRVETPQAMHRALKKPWDLVISDHSMPSFSAPDALDILNERNPEIPFIIVSGHLGTDVAVTAMRAGARDYIKKDQMALLLPVVDRELRDIERRRSAAEEFTQHLMHSMWQLSGAVAHEINNPLSVVSGYAQMLLGKDLPVDVEAEVQAIYDGSQRIAAVIRKMLQFVSRDDITHAPVNINDVLEVSLGLCLHELKTDNIAATAKFEPRLPPISGDAARLQQAFMHLITNARIEMKLAHNKGKLHLETRLNENTVSVTVSDDGPGIDEENLERIFEPFFSTRDVGHGQGLGLSICRAIVTAHGGEIYATSRPGNGCAFTVNLPAGKPTSAPKTMS